jgi:hypothetical protein
MERGDNHLSYLELALQALTEPANVQSSAEQKPRTSDNGRFSSSKFVAINLLLFAAEIEKMNVIDPFSSTGWKRVVIDAYVHLPSLQRTVPNQ